MRGSCVNPLDVDLVEPSCKVFPSSAPFHCTNGTVGFEGAGVVTAVGGGAECKGLQVGDEVWGLMGDAYAEYAVAQCKMIAQKPKALGFPDAGTIPSSGLTSLQCLKAAGAPWTDEDNVTMAITSGQGGTGFLAVQLARALGASRVVTAASGAGIEMVKSLGADLVVDYRAQELFDALPDDSVDVVFDNYGRPGTADKAMRTIRPGGLFLVLTGSLHGDVSKHPKPGVRQIKFQQMNSTDLEGLRELSSLFEAGQLRAHTFKAYGLSEVPQAFTQLLAGGVCGKLAVVPNEQTALPALATGVSFV